MIVIRKDKDDTGKEVKKKKEVGNKIKVNVVYHRVAHITESPTFPWY